MKKMTPEELEKFVHQQLRGLPARRAPNSLESRVLAAIEQQAAIPWYHKSWSYWPTAIRTAFLVFATAVTSGVIAAFYSGFNGVSTSAVVAQAGERFSFFTKLYHVVTWIADVSSQLVATIPPLWLYGGMATIAVLYATFFGLGAAAYRTLYRNN
jgi:hypothetical protein